MAFGADPRLCRFLITSVSVQSFQTRYDKITDLWFTRLIGNLECTCSIETKCHIANNFSQEPWFVLSASFDLVTAKSSSVRIHNIPPDKCPATLAPWRRSAPNGVEGKRLEQKIIKPFSRFSLHSLSPKTLNDLYDLWMTCIYDGWASRVLPG